MPVTAVVDYALTSPEIDGTRLALIGYSLGGYLAPRAAAYQPRIKACVASPLAVDIGAAFRTAWPEFVRVLPGVAFDALMAGMARFSVSARWAIQHSRWATGVGHPNEFFTAWRPYTLHGLADRLTAPLLVVFGEDDLANMPADLIMDTADSPLGSAAATYKRSPAVAAARRTVRWARPPQPLEPSWTGWMRCLAVLATTDRPAA